MAKHSTRTSEAEVRTLPEAASLRTDQRERRQRIIDAAERMMFDTDYEKIQVKDVADEAEVALGTLYRYFNSKDHLFACALQSWSASFGDHLELAPTGPTEDRVKAIYRLAARAFERQPRVYSVMMQIQSSNDAHAVQVWRDFARTQSDAFGLPLETLAAVTAEAERRDGGDERGARREPAQLAARVAALQPRSTSPSIGPPS